MKISTNNTTSVGRCVRRAWASVNSVFAGWVCVVTISLLCLSTRAYSQSISTVNDHRFDPASVAASVRLNYQHIESAAFPKIVSYVSVWNDSGRAVEGLTKDNFIVHEDGTRELPILVEELIDDANGVSVVLVLDRSGSMEGTPLDDVKKAATTFVQLMNNQDQAAIVSFAYFATTDHAMSNNKSSLIKAINALVSGGGTAIYDAVIHAANLIAPIPGRRAIILLTDGADNSSSATFKDAFDKVAPMNMPIYTIGLGPNVGSKEERNLRQLADSTHGRYFYSPTSSELEAIYREISRLLHLMYRITYTTHNCTMDSTVRNVRIDVQYRGLTSYGTKTYQAPGHSVNLVAVADSLPMPGRTFGLKVEIPSRSKELLSLSELRFTVKYSSQHLKPKAPVAQNIVAGPLFGAPAEFTMTVDNQTPGTLIISFKRKSGLPPVKGRGVVAKIFFAVSQTIPANTQLNFELTNLEARTPEGCSVVMRIENLMTHSYGLIVWPGDTNNNGKVELTDVLVLGLYWDMLGPMRTGPEDQLAWMPHIAGPFSILAATHADADGSGGIIERDLIPIGLNWGKVATTTAAPKVISASGELPDGEIQVAIAPGAQTGQYRLQLLFNSSNGADLAGITFRVIYPAVQMAILSAHPGTAWLEQPLVVTHDNPESRTFAMGVMTPAGAPMPKAGGELVVLLVQADHLPQVSEFIFQNVALVAADGQIREMTVRTDVESAQEVLPNAYTFYPAHPNPVSASTAASAQITWRYYLPENAAVKISIYNMTGQQIRSFEQLNATMGYHELRWNGTDLHGHSVGSGLYFVMLEAIGPNGKIYRSMQKITVVK
ncbi:MAG: VWA domain-containing protein [candidate division KSB1 bacterium]|nr:VWA domain-containing protein [candidate division KSB1 bacterium]MDZ7303051.1 VWA domain-containing protein [candidate division KSB1 bacterium]MDZ7312441.1 VWA domain-containing protein [candidate division KSB1 bacterium]